MSSSARATALETTNALADTLSSWAARRMTAACSGASLASSRSVRIGMAFFSVPDKHRTVNCTEAEESVNHDKAALPAEALQIRCGIRPWNANCFEMT